MSVTAARGFVAGATHAGIRKQDRLDLALVHSTVPATGAGMFTVNRMQAARVTVCKDLLSLAQPQALVANSGVANAATGAQGLADARAMAAASAEKLGIAPEQVLVLSTGVIGATLPIEKILTGIDAIELGANGDDAAHAIMTTDTHAKQSVAHSELGFTVGGMSKGSGMIHPSMATMLAIVTTAYPLDAGEAIAFLRPALDPSCNAISVDGECSTNDPV